jgi:hypothetical protein
MTTAHTPFGRPSARSSFGHNGQRDMKMASHT